ncbi:MAG TPA: PP2C family serine/threonine-protein phosphatase [Candidatus Nitrosocosmicus sp.]|nr:PP2C family serine/threonine-protein phosphatase [Candidatus Nitrosocosmicus sp.]
MDLSHEGTEIGVLTEQASLPKVEISDSTTDETPIILARQNQDHTFVSSFGGEALTHSPIRPAIAKQLDDLIRRFMTGEFSDPLNMTKDISKRFFRVANRAFLAEGVKAGKATMVFAYPDKNTQSFMATVASVGPIRAYRILNNRLRPLRETEEPLENYNSTFPKLLGAADREIIPDDNNTHTYSISSKDQGVLIIADAATQEPTNEQDWNRYFDSLAQVALTEGKDPGAAIIAALKQHGHHHTTATYVKWEQSHLPSRFEIEPYDEITAREDVARYLPIIPETQPSELPEKAKLLGGMYFVAEGSDIGKRKENQEDRTFAGEVNTPDGVETLLIVADGVGGDLKGETASGLAVIAFRERYEQERKKGIKKGEAMKSAVTHANHVVYAYGKEYIKSQSTTTIVAASLSPNGECTTINIGDSRACVVDRNGRLTQLTRDDSRRQLLRDQGVDEEVVNQTEGNLITNALGIEPEIASLDIGPGKVIGLDQRVRSHTLYNGSSILLSSDGFHDRVPEDTIVDIINTFGPENDPAIKVEEAIKVANRRGGKDNISVIIAKPKKP